MARYTDDFRAQQVALLISEGYPDRRGALTAVAEFSGVHPVSLRRWYRASQDGERDIKVRLARADLTQAIKDLTAAVVVDLDDARQDANFRDLAYGLGTLVDRLQLLSGGPTANINVQRLVIVERDD